MGSYRRKKRTDCSNDKKKKMTIGFESAYDSFESLKKECTNILNGLLYSVELNDGEELEIGFLYFVELIGIAKVRKSGIGEPEYAIDFNCTTL